ncbi:MAG: FAD-binding protein, partial [Clostridia bacterium]|nr:FAD-binding protein [Clostridia bacterium]
QGIEKAPVIYDLSGNPLEGDYNVYEKVEGDGPYYAVKGAPWIYSTTGALDVDEQFRVLKTDGEPLEGLYAVGTDCLGVLFTEKKEYVTYGGADQGWAVTSGYLAGRGLAETILAE